MLSEDETVVASSAVGGSASLPPQPAESPPSRPPRCRGRAEIPNVFEAVAGFADLKIKEFTDDARLNVQGL